MSDRLRFRAWDVREKKYWYDVQTVYDCDPAPSFGALLYLAEANETFVIEQCAGLKDETGKLIFEGDILAVIDPNSDRCPNIEVKWSKTACTYRIEYPFGDFDFTSIGWAQGMEFLFTVIGNIHENPELLAKAEDE